ncbi:MAG TPA: EamA family transporter [Acidimicrobiia bacterium]|nr:EamA family transporter [Acidimicrobiia bacterium]
MSSEPSAGRPSAIVMAAFSAVVVLGGANAVAVKQTVGELTPFWGAALRFVAAGAVMLLLVVVTRRKIPTGKSLRGAVVYGLLGFSASYGFLYTGIQEVPAGTLMVLVALTPLFTFGLAILHRQESFRIQGLIGAVIAVVGIGIVFMDQVDAAVPIGSMLLVMLGTVAIAESGVVAKGIPKSDPLGTNAVAMLAGGLVLFVLAVGTQEPLDLPTTTITWLATVYLVLFGSVAMFGLYLFTLQRWTASAVSYVTLLMPLVTVALAAILFDERVSPTFALGSVVILTGVYVGAFLTTRPQKTAETLPECLPVGAEDMATTGRPSPKPG